MKQLSKFMRSRFFLGTLCIILELIQLWAVYMWLYEVFLPVSVVGWVLYIGILLHVINRDEIPELKLLWVVLMLLMPLVGAFVLLLVSGNNMGKHYTRQYKKSLQQVACFQKQTDEIRNLEEWDPVAAGQARYLFRAANAPCHGNTQATYFPSGEDFHKALLEDLDKATHHIFLQYFIIQQDKMWDSIYGILKRKTAEGVQVYVMYDDLGCIALLPAGFFKQLEGEGIHCIPSQKYNAVLSHIHNNRDHRKIAVIDGTVGYTGGINLADEYINEKPLYSHWKDTALRLEGSGVQSLSALFITHWNAQHGPKLKPEDFIKHSESSTVQQGWVIPFGDGPTPVYPDQVGKNVYMNLASAAKKYLYITTPYLICDRALLDALSLAAKRGVDVRLVTPHIPDKKTIFLMTRSNYLPLLKSGVKIYEYKPGFIHAKNFLCDGKYGVVGTINLDYRSLVHHFECGVWLCNTQCLQDMKMDFDQLFVCSLPVEQEQALLPWWQRLFAGTLKLLSPLL